MDGIRSHHFETMGSHCLLVFTGESSSQALLGGAGSQYVLGGTPYSKYPTFEGIVVEQTPRLPWQIPPFLVEGQHHALKKTGIWSRGYVFSHVFGEFLLGGATCTHPTRCSDQRTSGRSGPWAPAAGHPISDPKTGPLFCGGNDLLVQEG